MAERMLRHLLDERGVEGVTVSSSGTWGLDGEAATGLGVEELRSRGIDGSGHVGRSLTSRQLAEADLVIAMTSVHIREISDRDPGALQKTVLLKEIPLIRFRAEPGESPSRRLANMLAAPRPKWKRAMDVDDPIGLPSFAYKRTGDELWSALTHLVETLWPMAKAPAETPRRGAGGP